MPEKLQSQSLAVLIDADNTSARHGHAIFEEIVKHGEANVRRIYGDFSGTPCRLEQADTVARDHCPTPPFLRPGRYVRTAAQ